MIPRREFLVDLISHLCASTMLGRWLRSPRLSPLGRPLSTSSAGEFLQLLRQTAQRRLPTEALKLVSVINSKQVPMCLNSYNAAMVACEERPDDVLRLLQEMEDTAGLQPDITALTAAARACESAGRYTEAFALNRRLSRALNTRREFDQQHIEREHRQMDRLGLAPGALSYAVLVAEYSKASDWKKSYKTLLQMAERDVKIPFCTLDMVHTVCADAGRDAEAAEVLELAVPEKVLAVPSAADADGASSQLPGYYDMLAAADFEAAQRPKQR